MNNINIIIDEIKWLSFDEKNKRESEENLPNPLLQVYQ